MPRPIGHFVDASTQTPSPHASPSGSDSDDDTTYNDLVSPTPQRARITTPGRTRQRPVSMSDEELMTLAHATKQKINWDYILHSTNTGAAKWKWLEHNGDFSIFVRERSNKYEVLAIGVVSASVAELVKVVHAASNAQYLRKMEAIYGDHFRDGCFVYNADIASNQLQDMSSDDADPEDTSSLVGLSVKTATFNKPNWRSSHEEWCYVDAVYQRPHPGGPEAGEDSFEKLMTSLRPQEIIAGLSPARTKYIENVVSGYLLTPEPSVDTHAGSGKATRVHFYCELGLKPNNHRFGGLALPSFGTTVADKAVQNRLLGMARSCARLPLIVRRRRLGMQDVIGVTELVPLTRARCVRCNAFLFIAKRCRLCGEGVCQGCSAKHYRETRNYVHHIRVCDICIDRVDRSTYSCLKRPRQPAPQPDCEPEEDTRPSEVLRRLLRDAYENAPSVERRASVLTVIKCVADQERRNSVAPVTSDEDVTSASAESETVVTGVAPTESDQRCQGSFSTGSYPVRRNEAQRLEAIEEEHLLEVGTYSRAQRHLRARSEAAGLVRDNGRRDRQRRATHTRRESRRAARGVVLFPYHDGQQAAHCPAP